jgi:hypothetical protein
MAVGIPQSFPTAYAHYLSAAADPGVTNDASQGFVVGSLWINTTGNKVWMCTANTAGAATWLQLG